MMDGLKIRPLFLLEVWIILTPQYLHIRKLWYMTLTEACEVGKKNLFTFRELLTVSPEENNSVNSCVILAFCSADASKELQASSPNSLIRVAVLFSPGSTIPW